MLLLQHAQLPLVLLLPGPQLPLQPAKLALQLSQLGITAASNAVSPRLGSARRLLRRLQCLPQHGILSFQLLDLLVAARPVQATRLQQLLLQLLDDARLLRHQAIAVRQLRLRLLQQSGGGL